MDGLQWCRERMLVAGSPLSASLSFAAPAQRPRILVLRTIAAELTAISAPGCDPGVAVHKLQWWQDALQTPTLSKHPALIAACATGLTEQLVQTDWNALLAGVQAALGDARHEHFDDLWEQCRGIGGAVAALEFRLIEAISGDGGRTLAPPAACIDLGAAGDLTRIVRDLAVTAHAGCWVVPLDLQAAFQIDRQQLPDGVHRGAWRGLVLELLSRAQRSRQAALDAWPAATRWRHRHLLISAALDARLARILARRPATILHRRRLPGRVGNLLTAWQAARWCGAARTRVRDAA